MEHSGEASRSGAPADARADARSGDQRAGGGDGLPLDRIRQRAYELYLARGGRHGSDLEDWLAAERELRRAPEPGGLADRVTADAGVLGAPSAMDTPTVATAPAGAATKSTRVKAAPAKPPASKTGTAKMAPAKSPIAKAAAPKPAAPKDTAPKPAAAKPAAKQAPRRKPRPDGPDDTGGSMPA